MAIPHDNQMKRVWALYRVSTKEQNVEIQREKCREYCKKFPNWNLENELVEKLSGFKTPVEQRDTLTYLRSAAEHGEFDLLLLYRFDRLGRRKYEVAALLEYLISVGVEAWSVEEGQQKIESQGDEIANFVRFSTAEQESKNASQRISASRKLLIEKGLYVGGSVTFGIEKRHMGRKDRKGRPVYDLYLDQKEVPIVLRIFELRILKGYGDHRISALLDKENIRTRRGTRISPSMVGRILRNRMFTGWYVVGDYSGYVPRLKIMSEDYFNLAQEITRQRSDTKETEHRVALQTKGKTLLSGNIFCGHCGGRISTTVHHERKLSKVGVVRDYGIKARYICLRRANAHTCNGQGAYLAERVDSLIENILEEVFCAIKSKPEDTLYNVSISSRLEGLKARLKKFELEMEELEKSIKILVNEIPKAILGKSTFSEGDLNQAIETIRSQIKEKNETIESLKQKIADQTNVKQNLKTIVKSFKGWAEEFHLMPLENKRMIVGKLIEKVILHKGYSIEIIFNSTYTDFCRDWEIDLETFKKLKVM